MLGKTSISAIRTLLFLAQQDDGACLPPRKLAECLGESPTYLAKVTRHMVRHGILEAAKGVKGGVRLVRRPEEVTLLAIVEACQGTIVGDYCRSSRPSLHQCSFHKAAMELHAAITDVLERWTLADLLENPVETGEQGPVITCLMAGALNLRPAAQTVAPGGLMQLGM